MGYRAASILAAARAAIDGTLAEIEADSAAADGERVHARLQRLAGVGPATAGFLVLLMGHFDRPAVELGDDPGRGARLVRRTAADPARGARPRRPGRRLRRARAGLVHAARLAARDRDRARLIRAQASGRRTRASRARHRRAQASQVWAAANRAPRAPSSSRSSASEASRASWRA